jgi:outer membrane immunogenic protein
MKSLSKWRSCLVIYTSAAAIALALGGQPAMAGNLDKQGHVKADDYLPSATATSARPWNGCRVYGELGYMVQKQRTVDNDDGGSDFGITFDVSTALDAATYGLGGGCDVQTGDKWVFGGFGEISWTNKNQQFSIPTPAGGIVGDTDIDHMITLAGRVGYLFTPKWMGYALGGYTWTSGKTATSFKELFSPDEPISKAFGDRGGWTVGIGTEAFIAEHWTINLEYNFTRLDGGTLQWSTNEASIANVDTDLHRVMTRLSYHF